MKYYVAIDGGGSKIEAILFDETAACLASSRSGSVNENFVSSETVQQNLKECFSALLKGMAIPAVEVLYGAYTGFFDIPYQVLNRMVPVRTHYHIGEPRIGLYAGGVAEDGILVISGTGSRATVVENNQITDVSGGWGALISDFGSGYYMGRMALQAILDEYEQRGEKTALTPMLLEHFGSPHVKHAVLRVYNKKAVVAEIASLSKIVSLAAKQGDAVARYILDHNAYLLAQQVETVYNRNPHIRKLPVVAAGGNWKDESFFLQFQKEVFAREPKAQIKPPLFEPVVGGVVEYFKQQNQRIDYDQLAKEYWKFSIYAKDSLGIFSIASKS